ncbi:DUF2264 domain-containing protein [Microlunatus parietis]|uniref:DUF2264 domain-containing protein n=1 Tax=Microlunatus parietis TaxID=682979 RepID=A0A7Y9LCB2_9ACTN|nr:DUF2264 domain-containing protein [Microlunatus parietis]NYE74654.1 hypothetical protein [Microlunatus parietis]
MSKPGESWTRDDLVQFTDRSLLALRRWATPGRARFDLPGPRVGSGPERDGLEAFARSFLAVGFRLSAAEIDSHDHAGWYAAGLAAGTDPESPEFWPSLRELPQARVEAAAIAIALHESRRWIWDALTPAVKQRVIDWLSGSVGIAYPDNNWRWFQNVTQAFLRSVGGPYDQAELDENLTFLDDCYLGDGWYSDGRPDRRTGNVDWYVGWVMHLFSLWYCRMSEGEPGIAELQARYAERLRPYLTDAADLFGADGAPLHQGRSLVYRHAVVGALWTGAVFDANPLPLGRLRRTALGAIRFFAERGAFDEDGLLSLGWLGRFEPMRQPYSGPGSPYWASLGLAGLVLPESHPVWAEPEQPTPIETGDVVRPIRPIGWLVSGTADDGIVRVINHGVDHSTATPAPENPYYNRYGYSSVTGPVPAPAGTADGAVDQQVALIDPDGRWSQRPMIERVAVDDHRASSRQRARFARTEPEQGFDDGPELTCVSLVRGSVEVRAVRFDDHDQASAALVISGYAVPRKPAEGARTGLHSAVTALTEGGSSGSSVHPVANAFGADLEVPWCRFEHPEPGRWYVIALCLGEREPAWPTLADTPSGPVITWPDGTTDPL